MNREPGFHSDVPESEYHGDPESLSQSGAKLLLKAPALYKWELDHPAPPKKVFELGTAAHALVLGVGAPMVAVHRYDPKTKEDLGEADDMKSPSSRVHADEIRAAGAVPLLRKEIAVVEDMAERLASHKQAMDILAVGEAEVTMYGVDEPTGILLRGRIDWLHPNVIADYKTAVTSDPYRWVRTAADMGVHQQAPWYLDLARQLGHPAKVFAYIVQEKTAPYLVSVVVLNSPSIKHGRKLNRQAIERLRDCRESGVWPGYAMEDTYTQVDIPNFHFYDRSVE